MREYQDSAGGRRPPTMARGLPAWTMVVPLVILIAVAFFPVLNNGFVQLDDHHNFVYNPHYRGLGRAEIAWAWTTELLGVYQPLGWMLLEVEYVVFGLAPFGYHLTSLLMHCFNTVALYSLTLTLVSRACPGLLARNRTGVILGSALAVVLFMVHPLRVEVVAWASCQTYLPCAGLAVLSARAYVVAVESSPMRRAMGLSVSWILLALALMCKATAVALPAVFLILDYYPLRRLGGGPGRWFGPSSRRVWGEKVPFVVVSAIFAALAIHAKVSNDAVLSLDQRGLMSRLAQLCYSTWFYLWKTVWPVGLCTYYPDSNHFDWRAPSYLLCAVLLVSTTAVLFRLRSRYPSLLAVWLAYLVVLAPNSGLVPIDDQIATDRYSYLASMSFVPLLAAVIAWLTCLGRGRTFMNAAIAAVGFGLVVALVGSTWSLSRTWRDTAALASNAIVHGGKTAELYLSLGEGLDQRGDLSGAEASFSEALRLEPSHVPAMVMLGMVRLRQGQTPAAIALLTEAVRIQPDMPESHNALGSALASDGRFHDALAEFTEALRLRPNFAEARANLLRVRSLAR